MRTLERLQKLAANSKSLKKVKANKLTPFGAVKAIGLPIASGGLLLSTPDVMSKRWNKSKHEFDPNTHKAILGLTEQ